MVLGEDGLPLDTDEAGMLQEKEVRSGEVGGVVASTFSWARPGTVAFLWGSCWVFHLVLDELAEGNVGEARPRHGLEARRVLLLSFVLAPALPVRCCVPRLPNAPTERHDAPRHRATCIPGEPRRRPT